MKIITAKHRQVASPIEIPQEVIDTFQKLGKAQRGKPEMLMVKAQHIIGGGVLNFVIEHCGDIVHRVFHLFPHPYGKEGALEKTTKVLRTLESGYGFEKEVMENLRSNTKGKTAKTYYTDVMKALYNWGNSFYDLYPVYNEVQHLCITPSIYIASGEYQKEIRDLKKLQALAKKPNFIEISGEFVQNRSRTFQLLPRHDLRPPAIKRNSTVVKLLGA